MYNGWTCLSSISMFGLLHRLNNWVYQNRMLTNRYPIYKDFECCIRQQFNIAFAKFLIPLLALVFINGQRYNKNRLESILDIQIF